MRATPPPHALAPRALRHSFPLRYFQWSPENNINSKQHDVAPGDELYGSITYEPASNSYVIYHNSSDGWSVSTPIPIQRDARGGYKNYSIAYFVYEKVAPCGDYGADEAVVFTDVQIRWDDAPLQAVWSTAFVEDVCNFRAHVVDPSTAGGIVNITWSTKGREPTAEAVAASQSVPFGRRATRAPRI